MIPVRCGVAGHRQTLGSISSSPDGVLMRKLRLVGPEAFWPAAEISAPRALLALAKKQLKFYSRELMAWSWFWDETDAVVEFWCPRHEVQILDAHAIQSAVRTPPAALVTRNPDRTT